MNYVNFPLPVRLLIYINYCESPCRIYQKKRYFCFDVRGHYFLYDYFFFPFSVTTCFKKQMLYVFEQGQLPGLEVQEALCVKLQVLQLRALFLGLSCRVKMPCSQHHRFQSSLTLIRLGGGGKICPHHFQTLIHLEQKVGLTSNQALNSSSSIVRKNQG